MANANTPAGLTPLMHRNGAPYNGAFRTYSIAASDATALFIGDPVKLAGTGQTLGGRVLSDITRAATGDVISGVVVGVKPLTQDSTVYRQASTLREIFVADDPELIFEVQEGGADVPLTANDCGLNINLLAGTGNIISGRSGYQINNASEATTATLDLHIVQPVPREDNAIGAAAKWLVTINRHQFANQTAGV